jgi:phosphoribosylanthranilate isomerase
VNEYASAALDSPQVKVCGITTEHDFDMALRCGADAIGLNFFPPSPRYIDVELATQLGRRCPPFTSLVALFVNATQQTVRAVLNAVPQLSVLQFHGVEPPEFCRSFGRAYIKSIGVREDVDLAKEIPRFDEASAILLDSFDPVRWGGTGRAFNWSAIPAERLKPLILAGGLTPENVAGAIGQVRPYAVDVCGGVEVSPGVKDEAKMEQFIRSVRSVRFA